MRKVTNYFPQNWDIPSTTRIRVTNLKSRNGCSAVANQYAIRVGCEDIRFQSYETTCLVYDWHMHILTVYPEAFGYSKTTSKYSKVFLMDEVGLSEDTVNAIKAMAKHEQYSRDCPLFIEVNAYKE